MKWSFLLWLSDDNDILFRENIKAIKHFFTEVSWQKNENFMPFLSASSSFPEQLNWAMWTVRLSENTASSIFPVFDGNFLWLIYHLQCASLHFDKEKLGKPFTRALQSFWTNYSRRRRKTAQSKINLTRANGCRLATHSRPDCHLSDWDLSKIKKLRELYKSADEVFVSMPSTTMTSRQAFRRSL